MAIGCIIITEYIILKLYMQTDLKITYPIILVVSTENITDWKVFF